MTTSEIKRQIKTRINLVDIIRSRGVNLKKKGRAYTACCPFHQEKTPSFYVSSEGFFKCFGCGKGGDHFSFLMEVDKISFWEALKNLSQMIGLDVSSLRLNQIEKDHIYEEKLQLQELNKRLVSLFSYFLQKKGIIFREYLTKRGISIDVISLFQIGFLPLDWGFSLKDFLISKGFALSFLLNSGIFVKGGFSSGYFLMAGRIIFPIKDYRGVVVGFGGRSTNNVEPKYLNSRDDILFKKRNILYGFFESSEKIRQQKIVIVCEGYMDVLSWHEAGVSIAVAPLGTSFTYDQANFLKRFVNKVIFCFDSDKAGKEATKKSFLMCESLQLECEVISLPQGSDPSEILEKYGKEFLKDLYENSRIHAFDYIFSYLREGREKKNVQWEFLQDIFKMIDNDPIEINRESKLQKVSQELNLNITSLKKDFSNWLQKGILESNSQDQLMRQYQISVLPSWEKVFLKGILNHPEFYSFVRCYLISDDFQEEGMKSLYTELEKLWENQQGNFSKDVIFEGLEKKDSLKNFFLGSLLGDEAPISFVDLLQTTFTIHLSHLQKRYYDLSLSIQEQERKRDSSSLRMKALMGSLHFMDKKLEKFREYKEDQIKKWEFRFLEETKNQE